MKTKLFLLLTVLSVLSTQAQNLTIKGRVTDTSQEAIIAANVSLWTCLLYTSPSPRDRQKSRMPSSA